MTCLKAECGDHITKEQFKLASQIICDRVPVLEDVKPLEPMFNFIHEHVLSILPKRKSFAYRKLENSFLSKLH